MKNLSRHRLGWLSSGPDFRDYYVDSEPVQQLLTQLPSSDGAPATLAERVDLREYFPEVGDQQGLHTCTAFAAADLVQYFDRRSHGKISEFSKLFVYKVTRKLLGTTGDTGADLRTTLRAIVGFGIPPEHQLPYDLDRFDEEPDAFLYAYPERYRSMCYVRLDARNCTGAETLAMVKTFLAAGFPCVFGFAVPSSITRDADVPYRPTFDRVCGGQAVVAVGYDDQHLSSTRGALLFRNSWGNAWGENGYGWLLYSYVEEQLATDFWTFLRPEWIESGEFQKPLLSTAGDLERGIPAST